MLVKISMAFPVRLYIYTYNPFVSPVWILIDNNQISVKWSTFSGKMPTWVDQDPLLAEILLLTCSLLFGHRSMRRAGRSPGHGLSKISPSPTRLWGPGIIRDLYPYLSLFFFCFVFLLTWLAIGNWLFKKLLGFLTWHIWHGYL